MRLRNISSFAAMLVAPSYAGSFAQEGRADTTSYPSPDAPEAAQRAPNRKDAFIKHQERIDNRRPNILFIPVDDLKPLIGAYGHAQAITPNMDRLARRGRIFLNAQCQQALCTPSRTSLLTGFYPDKTGVVDLHTPMRAAHPNVVTLPQYFREHGYVTAGLGKIFDSRNVDEGMDVRSWSLPFGDRHRPIEFDPAPPHAGYYQDARTGELARQLDELIREGNLKGKAVSKAVQDSPGSRPLTESMDVPDNAYTDGAIALSAAKLLEELSVDRRPFFLAVGFYKPHLPFVAPKKYWDLYRRNQIEIPSYREMPRGAPKFAFQDSWELRAYSDVSGTGPVPDELQRELIHGYLACVSYVDAQIGVLLDKLDELGLTSSTIVVLFGDHGWHLGDHGMWCKHTNYEQAVRTPLIIAAPGMPDCGTPAVNPAGLVDIYPTLCDLAGLPLPDGLQGASLQPILADPSASVKPVEMSQFPREHEGKRYMGYSLRDSRYRFTAWLESRPASGATGAGPAWLELYDYDEDPEERVNLAAHPKHSGRVAEFTRLLDDKLREIGR